MRIPIVLASAALLAACGSDSRSPMEATLSRTAATVAGVYDLSKVNSDPVPYTHFEHDIVIEEGVLTLTSEGRFTYSVTRSVPVDGECQRVTVDFAGSYSVRGDELHLNHAAGWRQVAAFNQGGIIVQSDPYSYLFIPQ